MTKKILILLISGLLTGIILNFFFAQEKSDISRVQIGEKIWNVEVVSDLGDRVKGLGDRASLEKSEGMLFIFSKSDFHGIWMKEMNFSIDIIWIDENLKVVGIKNGARPESYPEVFRPEAPAFYVLEINAGEAEEAEIKIGDMVEIL